MERNWRLVVDDDCAGSWNMALDEALLVSCIRGGLPTLRLYRWSRPTVSLGYFQPYDAVNVRYCTEHNIDIVRRPTGGRAVLHGHDLTFSIVLPESELPERYRSVRASHYWLMCGIRESLRSLGIPAEIGSSESRTGTTALRTADCFAHIADCDLHAHDSKVVGAAQVRKSGVLLEQGSIPYTTPFKGFERVFGGEPGQLLLPEVQVLSYGHLVEAIVNHFGNVLQVQLEPVLVNKDELENARTLQHGKYNLEDWTRHRKTALD